MPSQLKSRQQKSVSKSQVGKCLIGAVEVEENMQKKISTILLKIRTENFVHL